jgi:hypothetical protein
VATASGTPVLVVRFRRDPVSPRARARAICSAFSPNAEVLQVPEQGGYRDANPPIRPLAHSVLTFDLVDRTGHPTRVALDRVIAFLETTILNRAG